MKQFTPVSRDASTVVVTSIPTYETLALARASAAAYTYYTTPGTTPSQIGVYKFYTSFTGWNDIIDSLGIEETFGLIYLSTISKSAIVAFRGTYSPVDVYDDLDISYANFTAYNSTTPLPATINVAAGFYDLYTGVGGNMTQSMQQQLFSKLPADITTVYITGHSLGGALSQLFTLDMAASLPSTSINTINFASPQVGDQTWQNACDQVGATTAITRVINTLDYVPYYPGSEVGGYISIGKEFDTSFTAVEWEFNNALCNHSILNLTTVLQYALNSNPQEWTGQFLDAVFGYWNMQSTYPAISQEVAQQWLVKQQEAHALLKPHFPPATADMLAMAHGEQAAQS
jgi:triacylglycerol lipase